MTALRLFRSSRVVTPGGVDSHVHVNEPGRTEWEGFETATRAAAAGGVTTIGDMPLNSVPATTNADAVAVKSGAAKGKAAVDYVLWGGLVPANAGRPEVLDALLSAGVPGCKCFLVPSGVAVPRPFSVSKTARDRSRQAAMRTSVVWYPEREFSVEPALLRHRHTVTPYAGRALFGVVESTFLRGEVAFDRGTFAGTPSGRWLRPGRP